MLCEDLLPFCCGVWQNLINLTCFTMHVYGKDMMNTSVFPVLHHKASLGTFCV